MNYLILIPFMFVVLGYICVLWVNGIDYMSKNHPDYKGDDLFGE
jgi:hypothetical protein